MSSVRNLASSGTKAVLRNNAVLDDGTYKFGIASIKFDGNANSYVKSNEKFTVTSADWCLELWVNLKAQQTNSPCRIAQLSTDLPDQYGPGHVSLIVDSGLKLVVYDYDIATPLISTAENLLGAGWKHVAVSRQASTWRLFVDGVEIGTATWAGSIVGTNSWFIGGHPFSQTAINAWVDDVRFTFNKSRYSTSFTLPSTELPTAPSTVTITDTFIDNVTLLLPFDTSLNDVTNNAAAPVVNGAVSLSALQSKFGGYSASFDGASHLAYTVPNGLGSGNFTLEFWYYKTADSGLIFNSRTSGTADDGIDIQHDLVTTTSGLPIFEAASVATNTWTHVAIVRSGSTLTRYINGLANGSSTLGTSFSGTAFKVGGSPSGNVGYLSGYMDDFRLTNGVARYTNNFTPPGAFTVPSSGADPDFNSVSVLLHFTGNNGSTTFTDSSSNVNTIGIFGSPIISTTQSKFNDSSLYLNGSGAHITVPHSNLFNFGTSPFTIECWIYPTSFGASNRVGLIAVRSVENQESGGTWSLELYPGGYVGFKVNFTFIDFASPINAIILNQWSHVAVCRVANTFTLYVNGIAVGSDFDNVNTNVASLNFPVRIGGIAYGSNFGSYPYYGYIDEVRITKGIARYTANFTPPTAAYPDSSTSDRDIFFSNVKLLLTANSYFEYPGRDIGQLPYRLATFTPDWPVKVKPQQPVIRLNDATFGGKGRIYGTVKIKGIPNLPVSRRVRLFTEREGIMLAQTWSDPVTGAYEFLGYDPTVKYSVVTYDYQQNFRAVVADNLTPEAYNP